MAKTKYPYHKIYCQKIIDFFNPPYFTIKDITITRADGTKIDKTEMEALPPIFMSDFARSIGVEKGYRQLFALWCRKYPEFDDAYKNAKDLEIERYRVNGSMGLYNAAVTIFTLKNIAGWRDKTEVEHSGELKGPQPIIVAIPEERKEEYANRLAGVPQG